MGHINKTFGNRVQSLLELCFLLLNKEACLITKFRFDLLNKRNQLSANLKYVKLQKHLSDIKVLFIRGT